MAPLPDIDKLLAEDEWVRRLARRLVPDPHLADDLAQDAWVTALGGPRGIGDARALRPWLGGVLRNLVRSFRRDESRRARTEQDAARSEALPSAAEVNDEVNLRRELAAQLLELEEPYRSTLYLRFLRDQSLKRIAESTNVPVSTVHDRVQRGLEQMRARLDRAYDGKRSDWALVMVPLARRSGGPAATALGGIVMSTAFKGSMSLIVAGGLLVVWWQTPDPGPTATKLAAPSSEAARPPEVQSPVELSGSKEVRAAVDALAAPPTTLSSAGGPDAAASEQQTIELCGRAIDTSESPVPNLRIGFELAGGERAGAMTVTNGGGRFELERVAPDLGPLGSVDSLHSLTSGGRFFVDDPIHVVLALGILGTDELVLVVEPTFRVGGRVVDTEGDPIADASVSVRVHQGLYRELGFSHFTAYSEQRAWATKTDGEGGFAIDDACGGEHVFLELGHPGYASRRVELAQSTRSDLVVVLEPLADTIEVTGHVIDDRGAPVERARVAMGRAITATDHEGAFALSWSRVEPVDESFGARLDRATGEEGAATEEAPPVERAHYHVAALKDGYAPARLELEEADLTLPLVLQLGAEPLSIAGTVQDEEGNPLPGVVVWATNLTPFGHFDMKLGEDSTRLNITLEEGLRGGWNQRGVKSDDEGAFELEGLMPREYDIQAFDPRTATSGDGWTVQAGTSDVELVVKRDPSIQRVAGRIVSPRGTPISGVAIQVQRPPYIDGPDTESGPPDRLLEVQTTDSDGRFEFPQLATADTKFMLFSRSLFVRYVDLRDYADLAHMEIVESLLYDMQIEFSAQPDLIDSIQVLDASGAPLSIVQSFGNLGNASSIHAAVEDGTSRVLRVPETARTLILMKDGQEIGRRPLAVDPTGRTVVRP
jgi:RNA polymerase sigma-70 factor (ECF subfamily)